MKKRAYLGIFFFLCTVTMGRANVELHPLFSDNMVVQQGTEVPVWGWGAAGEEVGVTLGDQTVRTTVAAAGKWSVRLKPMTAATGLQMTVAGKNTIVLKNVAVGEVWICSGQSNAQWPVSTALNAQQEIAAATYPDLRFFQPVFGGVAVQPQERTRGSWQVCSPGLAGSGLSALGYYFGRSLHQNRKVPVGVITCGVGGTNAETWTSPDGFAGHPELAYIRKQWEAMPSALGDAIKQTTALMETWRERATRAVAAGEFVPPLPAAGGANPIPKVLYDINQPCVLFNGFIAPLVPCAFQGVVWYQGESNCEKAYEYRTLFPALIRDWRKHWDREFPFLYVQICGSNYPPMADPNPTPSWEDQSGMMWGELREAQTMALSVPKTAMVLSIDVGDMSNNMHPTNKQEIGRRLALAAEAVAYGQPVVYQGPRYERMTVEGGKIRIHFTETGRGLAVRGKGKPAGVAVAGADRKFYWADARIDGATVLVSSPQVAQPVAVRYGWGGNISNCNLCSKDGWPVVPFRTDDYPGVTWPKGA